MAESRHAGPALQDSTLLTVAALLLFLLLGQDSFYKADGQGLVLALEHGEWRHHLHALYLPIVHGLAWILAPLELGTFRVATVASAGGTALGVFFLHRAALERGLSRVDALLAVLFVALSPAVLFFATVVELHGPFQAFAGLAWLGVSRLDRHARTSAAVGLGAATGLAALAHGTGHLLPALLLPWFFARQLSRRVALRRILTLAGIALGAHVLLTLAAALLFLLLGIPTGNLPAFLEFYVENLAGPDNIPHTLFGEWLVPFLPLSLLWIPALFERTPRVEAAAFGASLVLYLAAAFLLVGRGDEYGAYLLPLAYGAACLGVRVFKKPVLGALLLLSLLIAVYEVERHDHPRGSARYVTDLMAATEVESSYYLLVSDELDPMLKAGVKNVEFQLLGISLELLEKASARDRPRVLEAFSQVLEAQRGKGKSVYLTKGAFDMLKAASATASVRVLLDHLESGYEFEDIQHGSFRAYRIEPKD
ncbi:MAG: hypothetical protein ACE5F1_02060 [Planctomycetota bacterium]